MMSGYDFLKSQVFKIKISRFKVSRDPKSEIIDWQSLNRNDVVMSHCTCWRLSDKWTVPFNLIAIPKFLQQYDREDNRRYDQCLLLQQAYTIWVCSLQFFIM